MKQLMCFLCCLVTFHLEAKTFSIMHPEYNQRHNTDGITLNGIVFVSTQQWVVWINHQRITPNRMPAWLKVKSVTETSIDCDYLYNGIWYHVILEPHDSFIPIPQTKDLTKKPSDPINSNATA